ncbi:hypothetical protein [Streptomyces sp. 150FB]|uniref:hypothetical protein n=1 Tax=Streptomyces sp. 150FB TaxID=1576605 RepID=UPI001364C039
MTIPFDARDLPGYAAGVFDHLAGQPALMRMVLWKQLERPEHTDHERTVYGRIVDALVTTYDLAPGGSSAQAAERAQDLLFAVLGLATAPFTLAPSAAQPARSSERSVQQRQDLHRAVSTIAANLTLRAGARATDEG